MTPPPERDVPSTRHRLSVLGAALLFSTGGAAIKACALTGWQVAGARSGIAALVLFALLPAARRGWNRRTLSVGAAYAATMVLFVLANKNTTAANSIFLQSTAPLYVMLLAPLLLREALLRRDLVFGAAIAGGLALFFVGHETPGSTAPAPLLGNLLATAAGVTWGLTLMGLRWLERQGGDASGPPTAAGSGMTAVVVGNAIAFAVCLPFALAPGSSSPTLRDALAIAYLGLFQIGLAYLLLTHGFRRLRAVEASLLILLEPTLNPVWAWLTHGERPSPWALAGGAVILLATAGRTLLGMQRTAGPPVPPSSRPGR